MRQGPLKIVAVVGVLVLVGIGFLMLNPPVPKEQLPESSLPSETSSADGAQDQKRSDRIIVGGIERPATDVRVRHPEGSAPRPIPKKPEGPTPRIDTDTNPQVAKAYEALKTGSNPERYSSFIVPASFDKKAFHANPETYAKQYAETVEPGRVFVTAQPEDGVSALRSLGRRMHRVVQGETVRLTVAATPSAPVTFTSFGMGQFENSLTSITVVANKEGKASAVFTASTGTKNEIKVMAASPVMSDQVTFVVNVQLRAKSAAL